MSGTNVIDFHDLYVNSQTLVICVPNSHDHMFVLKLISSYSAFIVDAITVNRLENKSTMRSCSKCPCGTKQYYQLCCSKVYVSFNMLKVV